MVKANRPFLSLLATGRVGKHFRIVQRGARQVFQASPDPPDVKSLAQLSWRHMYQKAVALWHALSGAEKREWESTGTARHMTGFAWFMSQCLKPNPGLYLPLQGGIMSGEIFMAGEAISGLPDPGAPQDADTLAAREAAITAALEDCIDSHIHGWDGSAWQKLLTESNTLHNLRVKLYDGADGISSHVLTSNFEPTDRGLHVASALYALDVDRQKLLYASFGGLDALTNITRLLLVQSRLHAFNGAQWDRLRSYGTGILKVGRAEVGLLDIRRINAGQVKASPGKLYWITMNPSAANSIIELSNDLDGSGAVKWDMRHGVNSAHHMNIDPPLEFSTGIYLKTLTNFTSVIFGYL